MAKKKNPPASPAKPATNGKPAANGTAALAKVAATAIQARDAATVAVAMPEQSVITETAEKINGITIKHSLGMMREVCAVIVGAFYGGDNANLVAAMDRGKSAIPFRQLAEELEKAGCSHPHQSLYKMAQAFTTELALPPKLHGQVPKNTLEALRSVKDPSERTKLAERAAAGATFREIRKDVTALRQKAIAAGDPDEDSRRGRKPTPEVIRMLRSLIREWGPYRVNLDEIRIAIETNPTLLTDFHPDLERVLAKLGPVATLIDDLFEAEAGADPDLDDLEHPDDSGDLDDDIDIEL